MSSADKILVTEFATYMKAELDKLVTAFASAGEVKEFNDWCAVLDGVLYDNDIVANEDPVETSRATSADDIDHTVVSFGKYKGKTPSQIALENEGYLTWAYEKLDKRFCSYVLYKDCGGRGPARWPVDIQTDMHQAFKESANSIGHVSKPSTGYFDYDDDIPF